MGQGLAFEVQMKAKMSRLICARRAQLLLATSKGTQCVCTLAPRIVTTLSPFHAILPHTGGSILSKTKDLEHQIPFLRSFHVGADVCATLENAVYALGMTGLVVLLFSFICVLRGGSYVFTEDRERMSKGALL